MLCVSPILLTKLDKKRFPEGLLVSCGSCINCRKQRAREWGLRLEHEKNYAIKAYFVTLTYNKESITKCYSVVKGDLQRYIKRLRKNSEAEIKYYACGEYGDQFGRPHYHIILMVYVDKNNNQWEEIRDPITDEIINEGIIKQNWPYGIVHTGTVNSKSINYVVAYVDKKILQYHGKNHNGRKAPFRIMSQGIGGKYAFENAEKLKSELAILDMDKPVGLPRYYKKILGINPSDLHKKSMALELEQLKKYMKRKRIKKMDKNKWITYYAKLKKQRGYNAEARYNIKNKPRMF